jgi:hypothetical protein
MKPRRAGDAPGLIFRHLCFNSDNQGAVDEITVAAGRLVDTLLSLSVRHIDWKEYGYSASHA